MEAKYSYCELHGSGKMLSSKLTIRLDIGEESGWFGHSKLKDDSGKVIKFNSIVDALNYMGDQGWEFVQAYTVTISQQNVYRWLLKKQIS